LTVIVETLPPIVSVQGSLENEIFWPNYLNNNIVNDLSYFFKTIDMKKLCTGTLYRSLLVLVLSFVQTIIWAQDSTSGSTTVTKETTTTTTTWYAQPWVWVVGGAVFIIILVALFRGNSTKEKEVSRTTVIKDKDYR
jgi:hypothetical protein